MTNRLILYLFAWGVVCCAISRWRLAGIGVGEVMVGLASLLAIFRFELLPDSSPVLRIWLRFAGLSGVALLTGTLWAVAIGVWDPISFGHDALALAFCFGTLTILLSLFDKAEQRTFFMRQFFRANLALAVVNLLFYGVFQFFLGETTVWIGRFNGLSANPNQLALYVCPIPFWLLKQPFVLTRWETVLGVGGCLSVGWLTRSDALLLAWSIGFIWLIAQFIQTHLWRIDPVQNTHAKAFISLLFVLVLVGVVAFAWEYVTDVYAVGGQGDLRVQRWQNGLVALGHSPVFGLGPGTFSGDKAAFDGQEAHNLYIDWLASGGLLAGLALFWFQGQTWLTIKASRSNVLMASFVSLLVFSSFHYVARHPVFWLYHLLLLLNPPPPCAVSSVR